MSALVGKKVEHKSLSVARESYGIGTISQVENNKITVEFDNGLTKRFREDAIDTYLFLI